MTNRDSANRGELDGVLANLALIYRPQASPANEFLFAAEALIREQERALAESRAEVEALRASMAGDAANHVAIERDHHKARAERLAGALRELVALGHPNDPPIIAARAALNLEPTP